MPFTQFNFNKNILDALEKNNYLKPTLIQEKVIPLILQKKDVKAKAQTGSGKSAAFVLPILKTLSDDYKKGKPKIKVLVLVPTRELALQVSQSFKTFSEFYSKKPELVTFIGGLSLGDQLHEVQKGCEILVSTAGRLLDILSKKQINLSFVEFFVLDEADKMLDMGFEKELDLILNELPKERQNLMFSASYSNKMLALIPKITQEYISIDVNDEILIPSSITQRVIEVNENKRSALLKHLLKTNKWDLVLVFIKSRRAADNIAFKFRELGFEAESFHGDLEQEERIFTLEEFKAKKIRILFATDIAARGLHIDDIECIVNYDLPRASADYIHRVGRTARASKKGEAISFIDYESMEHFELIKKRCKLEITHESIEGFELTGVLKEKVKGQEAIKGKRKSKKDKLREAALKAKKD